VRFATLRYADLSDEVRLRTAPPLDTIGDDRGAPVMSRPMLRRCSRACAPAERLGAGPQEAPRPLDAAFGGTAAHGIELDDGYRVGSAHCGCTVVPAALSVVTSGISGSQLIEAVSPAAGCDCLARVRSTRQRASIRPARRPAGAAVGGEAP
jgi:2-methylcitrate dehydratase PrpD